VTTLAQEKTTRQRVVHWNGNLLRGYEIHHGQTQAFSGVHADLPDGLGWRQGNVYGVYLHGLFENPSYRQQFLARLGWQGQTEEDWTTFVDAELNRIAQLVPDSGWRL
jgi:adenosylcobyric acid synthase